MITAILVCPLYLVVSGAIYISDGWFDYFNGKDKYLHDDFGIIICSIFWPLTFVFILGAVVKRNLQSKREEYNKKKEQETRIRVAAVKKAEAELALIESQLDQELRSSYKSRHV
jgi:hypothetical protein